MTRAAICRFGGIGDDLIAASVLPGLRKKYDEVDVLSDKPASEVFENNPFITRLILPDRTPLLKMSAPEWQQWFHLRGKEYDFFVNLSHSCETMGALSVGQSQFWWPEKFRRQFCAKSYLEIVCDICDVPYEFKPLFYPTEEELEKAHDTKKKTGNFIAWILTGSRIDKVYPYATLAISRIIRDIAPVVMLGGPGRDFECAKAIMEHVERDNGSAAGLHLGLSPDHEKPTWPIRRVCTMPLLADAVITPDTGPAWAAAMYPVPKILLLSHASKQNIVSHWKNVIPLHADPERVPCWPCHRLHDEPSTCKANKDNNAAACMSDISVDRILSAIKDALNPKNVLPDWLPTGKSDSPWSNGEDVYLPPYNGPDKEPLTEGA